MSNLKIGFGRADITPPLGLYLAGYAEVRQGDGWLDDLAASALAFSDGETTAVVLTVDNIGITQMYGDELRKTVARRTGLPPEAVFFACTHIHTAPSIHGGFFPVDTAYNSVFFRQLADAAATALSDLSDGEVYAARGKVTEVSFIRRFRMKDGSTRTNPGRGNPNIAHPLAETDDTLQLVRIVREGKEELVILNFQTHPDVIGGTNYSADWPGHVRRIFESAVPGTKCLFFNGAEGDSNHIDVRADSPYPIAGYEHSLHMGRSIAGEAMKLYTYAERVEGDGRVAFAGRIVNVKVNKGTEEELRAAEGIIALHEAGRDDEIPASGMELTTAVYEAYRMQKVKDWGDTYPLYLAAVRFGNVAFAGFPGEPFTEVGCEVRERSPFAVTIPCCCANGYEAYFPMQSAFDEGGYEARSCEFAAGVAETLIGETVEMLNELDLGERNPF